ncbi:MAG: ABC transporter ATP-binding protein, partial [Chloroflexi bacterium]
MSIVSLQNLSMFYGAEEIFSGVSADIHHGARIALVGPNGAGKTTLVNLILGFDEPTEGRIFRAKDLRLGHLPQQVKVQGEHTLYEEALRAFAHIKQLERDMADLAEQMADGVTDDAVMATYSKLQEAYEAAGGYEYMAQLRIVLAGLGFTEEDYDTPLPQLSGGQRTRALLARLLLEAPDLLILDEPTNHLDIEAVEWLENYLKSFSGAVLAVSHDRYFIDNFASTVWELEFGMLEVYRGNYSHYARQREERRERLLKEYEQQQEFLAKEEAYIRKNMGGRLTAQAKGRLKRLQTMAKRGKIISGPPRNRRKMHLRLKANARSGDEVLKTRGLVVGYDEPLLQVPDFTLYRGETAALIGPNGVGKSTFLKTIIGQLPPLAGEARLGAQVKIGY